MKKLSFSFILLLPSLLLSAQTNHPADTLRSLGEVTVTAIKQSQNMRLQPIGSTLVGAADIERFNITTMKGVSELAPNFYIPDYGSRMTSSIYVRGIGARIDQPSVGLTVDNVTYLNKDAYDFDLTDIVRIEVLRGAQSSLYGRNTMAGQINIYTLSPMDWQGTRVLGQMGSGPEARLALSHYFKRSERLAMSLSGNFNFSDGFYRNYYNSRKVGTDKSLNLRWKTQSNLSAVLYLENVLSFGLSRQGGYPYELKGSGLINYNDTCFYRRNALTEGLTLRWKSKHFTLSSITGLQYIDDDMTLDQDFTPLKVFTLTQKRHELALTQDFILRGQVGRWKWLAGLFGFLRNTHMRAPVKLRDDGIAQLITDRVNKNDKIPIKLRWNGDSIVIGDDFTLPVWGGAVYHQSSFDFGRWDIGVGLRLDYERTGLNYHSYCNTAFNIVMPTGMSIPQTLEIAETGRLRKSHLEFLPKLSVSYHLPMPGASTLYATVGKGYKSGGYNTQMFSEVVQQQMMAKMMENMPEGVTAPATLDVEDVASYSPERSWNYEMGIHVECADRRVHTDLAFFYIDCRDQQLTMFPEGTTTGRITTNANRARMWGVEAQIRFMPSERWLFNLNYGFTDARFTRFSVGENDYKNRHVPYAPSNTLFLSATYRQPLPWNLHRLDLTASTRGVGRIYWDEANTVSQPFYAQLQLSATAHFSWLEAELWAENLTGTKFDVFYFRSMGNDFLQRGKPRRYGLTLRFRFD